MSKKFAPTLITIIICIGIALIWGTMSVVFIISGKLIEGIIGVIIGIVVLSFMGVFIVNLIRRYHEIDKEEDNDLSKY